MDLEVNDLPEIIDQRDYKGSYSGGKIFEFTNKGFQTYVSRGQMGGDVKDLYS